MIELLINLGYAIGALVFLPVLSYLMVKFASAAYFREKQKQQNNRDKHEQ